jgi:hypothetical protein
LLLLRLLAHFAAALTIADVHWLLVSVVSVQELLLLGLEGIQVFKNQKCLAKYLS